MFRSLFFILICFSLVGLAGSFSGAEKMSDLQQISNLMQTQYGPYDYKKKLFGITPRGLLEKYEPLLAKSTDREFLYLVNRFVGEFKDSHFGARVQTDHVSLLGFLTEHVAGKALIDEVDREKLPKDKFPFERGDELVSMDGRPVAEVAAELAEYSGMGNPESARHVSYWFLAMRPAGAVPPQEGTTELTIRTRSGISSTLTLDWQQVGEPLSELGNHKTDVAPTSMSYAELSLEPFYNGISKNEFNFRCSGKTRIAIPEKAVMLMKEPFVAYYHPTAKGNIGYVRIPHYSWRNASTKASENEFRFRQYEYVIHELEKNTVALIIDQDHNCGGSVEMVEKMVGLFMDKPYVGLQFQFLATRNEIRLFNSWVTGESRSTVEWLDMSKVIELMKETRTKGERLTPRISFQNNRPIEPNSIRYTKPVVILIDQMAGSGGDAFPAMMQGLGRAKLFGARTMGAGGHVEEFAPLGYSANTIRMTKSLFYHPNGTPIENNGASPDFAYQITEEDFVNSYKPYQKAYLEKLESLLN